MPAVKSPYRMNIADVPPFKVAPPSQDKPSEIDVRMVYGTDTGMMIAARRKGYHSRPHWHDSEQFNYILDGEIWFFIGTQGFRCRKGDIVRVPRNEIHWTWVRARSGCTMLETHTPSLTGDPSLAVVHEELGIGAARRLEHDPARFGGRRVTDDVDELLLHLDPDRPPGARVGVVTRGHRPAGGAARRRRGRRRSRRAAPRPRAPAPTRATSRRRGGR